MKGKVTIASENGTFMAYFDEAMISGIEELEEIVGETNPYLGESGIYDVVSPKNKGPAIVEYLAKAFVNGSAQTVTDIGIRIPKGFVGAVASAIKNRGYEPMFKMSLSELAEEMLDNTHCAEIRSIKRKQPAYK